MYIYHKKGMETILISGGTGLIGRNLTRRLEEKGFRVLLLSRQAGGRRGKNVFFWNPGEGKIDREAVAGADYIIHLAGAGIGDKRWTKKRKQEIVDSRVLTGQLIFNSVKEDPGRLKAFITASATGYYGMVTSERVFSEEDPPADDFTGKTCSLWEQTARMFETLGIRTVIVRTGVVFTPTGGALAKMALPARIGLGSPLGSGRQYLPWIHLDDLCGIYLKAVEDSGMQGVFNAVAPVVPTNRELTAMMAGVLGKALWLPPVPGIAMKALFGEMSSILLEGSRISSEKIRKAGYEFLFPEPEGALFDLFRAGRREEG